ncbi:MAG: hypothetical protein L0H25_03355 [Micrococcales bacterium]|nr:hypothetical protein [Micrococcales bacterium]
MGTALAHSGHEVHRLIGSAPARRADTTLRFDVVDTARSDGLLEMRRREGPGHGVRIVLAQPAGLIVGRGDSARQRIEVPRGLPLPAARVEVQEYRPRSPVDASRIPPGQRWIDLA